MSNLKGAFCIYWVRQLRHSAFDSFGRMDQHRKRERGPAKQVDTILAVVVAYLATPNHQ